MVDGGAPLLRRLMLHLRDRVGILETTVALSVFGCWSLLPTSLFVFNYKVQRFAAFYTTKSSSINLTKILSSTPHD